MLQFGVVKTLRGTTEKNMGNLIRMGQDLLYNRSCASNRVYAHKKVEPRGGVFAYLSLAHHRKWAGYLKIHCKETPNCPRQRTPKVERRATLSAVRS